jgi:hypothetical protein
VRRALTLGAAILCVTALAAPAGAQERMPTELWSAYPLVQKVQRTETTSIGPLLPPTPTDSVPAPDDSRRWSLWLAVAAVGALALLLGLRTAAPVASSGIHAVGAGTRRLRSVARPRPRVRRPKPRRERSARPKAPARERQAQYAPLPPLAIPEPDIERESRHYVARRTGFLRSRFVVVADEAGGKMKELTSSRSFWRVGRAGRKDQAADAAWFDLINDLRVAGWEPDSTRPSEFYVLLRRVDTGPSRIAPTIEAYTHES